MRLTPDSRLRGPKCWPLIGNFLKLTPTLHLAITEMGDKFGPIYKLKILDEHWVVISEFDLIHAVLVSQSHVNSGRPTGFRMGELGKGVGIPVTLDLDPTVINIRQLIVKVLKITGGNDKDAVTSHITGLLDTFDKHGSAYNPMHDLYKYSCGFIGLFKALLGEEIAQEPNIFETVNEFTETFVSAAAFTVDGTLVDKYAWTPILWQNMANV